MNKTEIEWTDYSWNPIVGMCPVGCWYCYGARMYKRFKRNGAIKFLSPIEIYSPYKLRKPSKIFLCSTFELFHESVKKEWRAEIFRTINDLPQHTFQILTKLPQNVEMPMPDNVWLGVTITGENEVADCFRVSDLCNKISARIKFISFEPMLGFSGVVLDDIDLLIIGRLTGHGNKYNPSTFWIERMIQKARASNTAIFLKNNLKDIWQDFLIQEMPK